MEKIDVSGSSSPNHGHGPWLVFPHDGKKSQTFFSLQEGKACTKFFPGMQISRYWPTPQGWLLILDVQLYHYFLLNPTTMVKIGLPPLKRKLSESCTCILSSSPTDPKCIIMCADFDLRQLCFCNPGGNKWVWHRLEAWSPGKNTLIEIFRCNGTLYGLTSENNLAIIDFTPLPQIRTLEECAREWPIGFHSGDSYFLESCGEIYHVFSFPGWCNKVLHFTVEKRNSKLQWEMVDSIGDRVFFLSTMQFAFSWSASKIGIKGNCIYFTRENDMCFYVFDMEDGTIQVHRPCDLREKSSTPFWMMPAL